MAATNKRGIFSLLDVRERQGAGVWSVKEDVWLSPSPFGKINPFGYFTGGSQNNKSAVTRLDFSNDSAGVSVRGPLTISIGGRRGLSSSSHGYVIGGTPGPSFSTVDRIDYSNDTATASPRGPLSRARKSIPGASTNADFGYDAGGYDFEAPGYTSIIERIDYSNDTATASPKGPLSVARGGLAAAGNQSFGYFSSGENPDAYESTLVDRLDYSNDTAAAVVKGPLTIARRRGDATGNASFGYHAGGDTSSPSSTFYTIVDRVDYSNDTATAVAKGPLTSPGRYGLAATGNASSGYFCGGTPSGPLSKIDRIDYSNDTATATTIGNMPFTVLFGSAFSPTEQGNPNPTIFPAPTVRENVAPQGTDFGYFAGGQHPNSPVSSVDRIDYSNDTATATAKGPLSLATAGQGATSSASFGYFGGGINPSQSPSSLSTVSRIDYSNDTAAAVAKGPLSLARYGVTGTGNASFGYFAGGYPSNSTVDRIDYSNDTATAVAKGPLSVGKQAQAATGNADFGYFGGGYNPNNSTVDRVDYSNDTATATAKGPLSSARGYLGATGNADFGYFAGGHGPLSSVDRIDYSNDTAAATAKGPLSVARLTAATGNASFGYFGGGGEPSGLSTVDRIDYANDTETAVAKGPLSVPKKYFSASSSRANAIPLKGPGNLEVPVSFGGFSAPGPVTSTVPTTDFGYFAGGNQGPAVSAESTVDRVDYSNDTATASPKGPLTSTIYRHTATGNQSFGYVLGGNSPSMSKVNRIDYSNDTATASLRGNLENGRQYAGATGNADFGYVAAGYDVSGGLSSEVQRVDYSNDTALSVEKGPLSAARYQLAAIGNQNFGYFSGGGPLPAVLSTVDRIDYSNDTATAAVKGPLSGGRLKHGATGNADFGYFGGGGSPFAVSSVDRIDYSNDTPAASPKGPLTTLKDNTAATGNSTHGYFGGGRNNSPILSTIDRIDYSNDTATASSKGPLSAVRAFLAATSPKEYGLPATKEETTIGTINYAAGTLATPNTGYFGGGSPSPYYSTVDRVDYSNDTATASVKGPLNQNKMVGNAVGNDSFGYFGGGRVESGPSPWNLISNVDRINYVNDTVTAVARGPLIGNRYNQGATGNKNFGYFGGGWTPNPTTIQRIDFANDIATAAAKSNMTRGSQDLDATGNQNFGYFGGGDPVVSTIDRLDYSNDTTDAVTKGPLSIARYGLRATGNADFGYFAGGRSPSLISTVDRIDYSNDTATAAVKGPLSAVKGSTAATGDASFGYFGGGNGVISTVDRIDYSNDTATASPKGPLSLARQGLAATSARENGFVPIGPAVVSNATAVAGSVNPTTFGYFGGNGSPKQTTIDRIDYSNDTATASPKGSLSSNVENLAATGNSFFGYFGGGDADGTPGKSSKVDRLDYSNDTANASPKGPLNHGRKDHSATGNSDFGYFITGAAPSNSSFIDRVDYSNDTATALTRGNNEFAQMGTTSTGNQNFGYVGGGTEGAYTHVSRIDYNNDTATSIDKGNLLTGGYIGGSTGNANFGYFGGGKHAPDPVTPESRISRIDYSNDTAVSLEKGSLSAARYKLSATGNADFGYFSGGQLAPGTATSIVERVDYSNDTTTAAEKGPLSRTSYYMGATSAGTNALPQ